MKRSRLHRNRQEERVLGLKHKTAWNVIAAVWFMLAVAYIGSNFKALEPVDLISPLPERAYAMDTVEPKRSRPETTTPEQKEIVAYIREVFGADADKALQVVACENSRLDPTAKNTYGNSPAGSTDWGIFMINDYWQKVGNRAFLIDYKINTQIAYNIFKRDGYSFKLWTCGRKLGI